MAQSIIPVASSNPHYNSNAPAGTMLFTTASCTGPGGAHPWLKVTDGASSAVVQVQPAFAADVLAYPGSPKCVLASDAEVTAEVARLAAISTSMASSLTARQAEVQARADEEKLHV